MAVDIKQLRIGSHVEVNGVRRAVFGLGCGRVSYLPHPTSSVALSVLATEVEPIPITPELLAELGFEKIEKFGNFCCFIKAGADVLFAIYGEKIAVKVKQDDNYYSVVLVRYLHEAEQFIYLTLGKEMIEE